MAEIGKIERGIGWERRAYQAGIGGRELVDKKVSEGEVVVRWKYLPGKVKWRWDGSDSKEVGRKCGELQSRGWFHLDLKPGNIIWRGKKIRTVIDFEECHRDKKWQWKDAANTLAWVLVSGGRGEEFIRGYEEKMGRVDRARLARELVKYLTMRQREGNKQAWIELARERLKKMQALVKAKQISRRDLKKFREQHQKEKIVFTTGAYELVHWGHIDYLEKAKKRGDLLVVGVASDESRRKMKGESHPLIGEATKAETLSFFEVVDGVVIVDEENISDILEKLRPEVLFTATKDWRAGIRQAKDEEVMRRWGGKVIRAKHSRPNISSSEMIEQVALAKVKQVMFGKVLKRPILKIKQAMKNKKVIKYEDLNQLGEELRRQRKVVVFTSLSADLFHLGHARFIQKAKSLGDVLVVGLPGNQSITALKGSGRPIVDETARVMVLVKLGCVDKVVIFDERTILGCLERLKPEIFFTVKEEWNSGLTKSSEAKIVIANGGKVVLSERMAPHLSASKIIDKAAAEMVKRSFKEILKKAEVEPVLNADFDPYDPKNQLAARERGFYEKVWKEAAADKCVFCDLREKYIIAEEDGTVLTVALFPYIDGHLLVIPKRHIRSIGELKAKEEQAIFKMIRVGVEQLRQKMGVENAWVLLREGRGIRAGKTVEHLHFHVLPYDTRVIKMGETKLKIQPLDLANKLRQETGEAGE
jgi:rfaE bifunctional protein nucleotidyltransferase chain/domain